MKHNTAVLSVRVNNDNPNHHLWWNHCGWWLHATVHNPDFTKQRVRVSLKTHDVEVARLRRDEWLARWEVQDVEWRDDVVAGRPCRVREAAGAGYALAA